jgi:hypothetical protein
MASGRKAVYNSAASVMETPAFCPQSLQLNNGPCRAESSSAAVAEGCPAVSGRWTASRATLTPPTNDQVIVMLTKAPGS